MIRSPHDVMTPDSLPDDAGALKALVLAAGVENERLIAIIKELRRHRFGPRSGENRIRINWP